MTQARSVYTDLTIQENLRYFADVVGASRKRVADVIRAVGLDGRGGELVRNLSGGEQSRVSLAMTLLGEPDVARGPLKEAHADTLLERANDPRTDDGREEQRRTQRFRNDAFQQHPLFLPS